MIGLDYLLASHLILASDVTCAARKTPQVAVTASNSTVHYDDSKTQDDLQDMGTDTVSPYGKNNPNARVNGLTVGEMELKQSMRFYQQTYPSLNVGCLSVDSLKVNINIKPVVYIARHFRHGSCMYNAVLEHERKHVIADQEIMAKYVKIINDDLTAALYKKGYTFGPFPIRQIPSEQQKLEDFMQKNLTKYRDQMGAERRAKQQSIDTLAEYRRVQRECE